MILTILLAGLVGSAFFLVDRIPSQFKSVSRQTILLQLEDRDTSFKIKNMKESPKWIVDQGFVIHPRTYRPDHFYSEHDLFEFTVLAKDTVYVVASYSQPPRSFTSGSKVSFIGCEVYRRTYWGVKTIFVVGREIWQQDNEGYLFNLPPEYLFCE